jgi:hypothetical protein
VTACRRRFSLAFRAASSRIESGGFLSWNVGHVVLILLLRFSVFVNPEIKSSIASCPRSAVLFYSQLIARISGQRTCCMWLWWLTSTGLLTGRSRLLAHQGNSGEGDSVNKNYRRAQWCSGRVLHQWHSCKSLVVVLQRTHSSNMVGGIIPMRYLHGSNLESGSAGRDWKTSGR